MNACFSCEKQLTEDIAIKGHYLCSNQRCIRFGLVTTVYLAPQTPESNPGQVKVTLNKDVEKGDLLTSEDVEPEGELEKDEPTA